MAAEFPPNQDRLEVSRRTLLRAGIGVAAVGFGAAALPGTGAFAAGGSAPGSAAAGASPGLTALPPIIDCAGWGARPPSGSIPVIDHGTTRILIHHTAYPNSTDYSRDQAVWLAQDIQNLHMDGNGWSDTGQHFTVSRGGYILEGRHGSLSGLQDGGYQVQSAHCPGENTRAIGIENEGTYVTATPTTMLVDSLVDLCTSICQQYGLWANNIFGHWDYRNTDCPGAAFYKMFPQIRLRVGTALGAPSQIPARTWPDIHSGQDGETVRAAQYLLRARGSSVTADGVFGSATDSAVRSFQSSHGIPVDGYVTNATWQALVSNIGSGSTGDTVRAAQTLLKHKRYSVSVTGTFDSATGTAVSQMRQLHGLSAGTTVDTTTWCAIVGGIIAQEFASLLH